MEIEAEDTASDRDFFDYYVDKNYPESLSVLNLRSENVLSNMP
jgi:hypothetical protein